MNTLAVAITNRCPLRCAFCCVPPGPGDIDNSLLDQIIDDVISSKHNWSSVGFTGGEPLVRPNDIYRCGEKLRQAGISWGLTTGLGWASNGRKAVTVAKSLMAAGISNLNVSFDPSHLSELRINGGFSSFCSEFSLSDTDVCISVTLFVGEKMDDEDVFRNLDIKPADNFRIERHYVSQTGFAAGRADCSSSRLDLSRSKCPMQNNVTLSVWPSGNVNPCCSTYIVNKSDLLVYGNVKDESINVILERVKTDPYMSFIRHLGFDHIVALFGDKHKFVIDAFRPFPIDVCELCSRLSRPRERMKLQQEMAEIGSRMLT